MAERIVHLVADPYPPYQYEETGTVKGVDHDVIVEAFRVSGYEARTRLLPWDRCMKSMEEASADGVYQIAKTPEREQRFLFSDLLRAAKTVFYRLKGAYPAIHDPRESPPVDFESRSIGVLAGYSYNPTIDGLKSPNKIEVNSNERLIQGLRKGRFELALMDQGVAEYLIAEHRIDDVVPIEGYAIERELFVAFPRKRTNLVQAFNSGLERLRRTSTYENIFAKYRVAATPTSRSS